MAGERLFTKLSLLTLGRIAGAGAVFLATLVISREFGPEVLAAFALCLAVSALASLLLPLGFQAIAQLIGAEYGARKQWAQLAGFTASAYRNMVLCWFALAGLCALAWYLAGDLFGPHSRTVYLFVLVLAPAMAVTAFNSALLTGLGRQLHGQLPDMAQRPVLMLLGVLALAWTAPAPVLPYVLGAVCLAVWSAAGIQAWLLLRRRPWSSAGRDTAERRRWWHIAPSWATTALLWDYVIEIHVILAGLIAAPTEVALLHVAFRIRVLAGFGMRAVYSVLLPQIYASNALEDGARTRSGLATANRFSLLYATLVVACLAAVGKPLLSLFGEAFYDAYPALVIIALTLVARAMFGAAPAVLGMRGHQPLVARVLAASLVLSLLLSAALYPLLGITGIAAGYSCANLLSSLVLWHFARTRAGINCWAFGLRGAADAA